MSAEAIGHAIRVGGTTLDDRLLHGAGCPECHEFLREVTGDRCCELHYRRRFGKGWAAHEAERLAELQRRGLVG